MARVDAATSRLRRTGHSPSGPTSSSWVAATRGPWRRSSWPAAGPRSRCWSGTPSAGAPARATAASSIPGLKWGRAQLQQALRSGARRSAVPGRRGCLLHRRALRDRRRLRLRLPPLGAGHPRLVGRASSTASRRSSRSSATRGCGAARIGAPRSTRRSARTCIRRHRHRGVGRSSIPADTWRPSWPPALAAGVDFHTGTPAERIEHDGTDRVVHTARGAIRAGAVLIATNGYTDGLVPWIGQRVMPIGSYIVATEPMSEELAASVSPRGRCFFDAKNFLYYWHVNAERRLIFGGRASFRADIGRPDRRRSCAGRWPWSTPGRAPAHRARVGRQRRRSRSTACRTWASATASITRSATAARGVALGTAFGLRMAASSVAHGGRGRAAAVRADPLPWGARDARRIAASPGSCRLRESGSGSRTGGVAAGPDPSCRRREHRSRPRRPTRSSPSHRRRPSSGRRPTARSDGTQLPPTARRAHPGRKRRSTRASRSTPSAARGSAASGSRSITAGHPARPDAPDRRARAGRPGSVPALLILTLVLLLFTGQTVDLPAAPRRGRPPWPPHSAVRHRPQDGGHDRGRVSGQLTHGDTDSRGCLCHSRGRHCPTTPATEGGWSHVDSPERPNDGGTASESSKRPRPEALPSMNSRRGEST